MESRDRLLHRSEAQAHSFGPSGPHTPQQERKMLDSEIMHLRSTRDYEKQLSNITRDNFRLQTELQYLHYVRNFEKQNADRQIQKLSTELLALKHLVSGHHPHSL